jgi:predicted membrane chloride channel (bestrophin family)
MSSTPVSGAAAIVNYDPKQPTLKSFMPWTNPSLVKVFTSVEFWFYTFMHTFVVFLTITDIVPLLDVDWKAAGAFQYFTTFFLTFYNGNCYARYQKLYSACTELMDGALLFVRELTICFKDETTWKHRLQATKWLLAAVDLFFMGVCGNKLSMKGWSEVVKKGLLTRPEAQMLLRYPGPEIVPILTTWTMIAVADGLEKPCFHEKKNPAWPICRTQKIAHLHNRLDRILIKVMTAYREISETMAQPIPYAYWHLMNLVFTLNFMLLAMILASFRHWLTIVPYCMALMTFMGLREVSNQLADPFGDDIVDFPLAKYLDYTFDHSICLLTAFTSEDAYERVRKQIHASPLFDDRQIRRHMNPERLYNEAYVAHTDGVFIWEREQPLQEASVVYEKESLQEQLRKSLAGIPIGDYGGTTFNDEEDLIRANTVGDRNRKWLDQAEEDIKTLRPLVYDADEEEERSKRLSRELPGPNGARPALSKPGSASQSSSDLARTLSFEGDAAAQAGEPLARPSGKRGVGGEKFRWGFQNHGRKDHAPTDRSFRMSDTPFELRIDESGRLRKHIPEPAKNPNLEEEIQRRRIREKAEREAQLREENRMKSNFDYSSHEVTVQPARAKAQPRGRSPETKRNV